MKERPILFNTPMVQAILEGRKSQTRRIVKMPDLIEHPDWFKYVGNSNDMEITRVAIPYDDRLYHEWQRVNTNAASWVIHSHKPGDTLWVKETWNEEYFTVDHTMHEDHIFRYKADGHGDRKLKWKSPRFMPKEACRIRLEIADVRVERLHEIMKDENIEDIAAEGIPKSPFMTYVTDPDDDGGYIKDFDTDEFKEAYQELWEDINGKESWNANPWVWVISFKRIM